MKLAMKHRIKSFAKIDIGYDNRFAIGKGECPVVHRCEKNSYSYCYYYLSNELYKKLSQKLLACLKIVSKVSQT